MAKHIEPKGASLVLANLDRLLPDLQALYKDVHAHPELSMQETRTAGSPQIGSGLAGYEVTSGVGKTGVVGLLRNGDGPTLMLRADMDALPSRGSDRACPTRARRRRRTARANPSRSVTCAATICTLPGS